MLVTVQKSALSPTLFFLLSSRGFGIPRPLHNQRITIYSTLQPHPNWYKQYPTNCNRQQYLQNKRYCMVKHAPAHKSRSHV